MPSSPAHPPGKKGGGGAQSKKSGNRGQANATGNQVNAEASPKRSDKKAQVNATVNQQTPPPQTPPPKKATKLDNLCNLLENIILEHGTSETPSPTKKNERVEGATALPLKPTSAAALNSLPSTSAGPTQAHSTIPEEKKELSREELERERKARKEAKKARKKGLGKENIDKEAEGSQQSNAGGSVKEATAAPVTAGDSQAGKEDRESSSQPSSTAAPKPAGQEETAGKSKAELRKERREKQEAQRQAKLQAKEQQQQEEKKQKGKEKQVVMEKVKIPSKTKAAAGEGVRKGRVRRTSSRGGNERKVPLLGHLPQYSPSPPEHHVNSESIHPAVLTVGLKMKYGVIEGATARVISMLAAFKRFISDYRTPESCDLSRDMADKLKPNVDFLHACRPHAIAMDNAIRSVKHKINSIDPSTPEAQAKDELRGAIDEFVEENITLASSTIASHATSLIQNDVLLTFGYSALVCDVVEAVVRAGGKVSVVVADSPHPPSGAAMVQRLDSLGVPTYYRLVTDLSTIMSKVTKVVVEAEAVMMNGAVQAMCGTACLALAAATHHKPFIVLSQTYKFCNIDLTDSLVINELGDPNSMVSCASQQHKGVLADWRDMQNLNVVRLVYDVTPASLVTVLVTEQSVLPTSAVPVIIHRKYADILGQD